MGAKSRRKGANGEREIAGILTELLGQEVSRRLGQAREGGHDLNGTGPYILEIKRRARIGGIHEWMAQAEASCEPGASQAPVVAFRADGERWLVAMRIEDWAKLVREELAK